MVTNVTFNTSHQTLVPRRSHVWHVLATGLVVAALPAGTACAQQKGPADVTQGATDEVADLPYARGRTFSTLDEYLAHLETLGTIDLPWWREIRPGVYERVTSVRDAPREVATREELMRRFGFRR